MKYLIYTRVSERGSKWRGDTSCSAQEEQCRKYVLSRHPDATFKVVTEEFKTGTSIEARPKFKRIMAEMENADWDSLVVLDLTRLARSIQGWLDIARQMTNCGKGLVIVQMDVDFSTPQGRMVLNMYAVFGQYFAESNAQKTREKMEWMAHQGYWVPGSVPYGYKRSPAVEVKGRLTPLNVLVVDPDTAPIIKTIFSRYAAGESTTSLSKRLNLHAGRIEAMLRNPVYLGRIVYGSVDVQGKHPAIITQALFHAVQNRLPQKVTAPRPQRHIYDYLLSGRVKCSCGRTMTASHATGRLKKKYPYYRCNEARCRAFRKMIRADQLDTSVLMAIAEATETDQTIQENWKRLVQAKINLESQMDSNLPGWRNDLAVLTSKAAALSSALQAGQLGPVSMKHLSVDLEALYVKIDAITVKIEAREAEIAALTPPDTVEELAKMWRETARDLADNDWPHEYRQLWVNNHVAEVRVGDTEAVIDFIVDHKKSVFVPETAEIKRKQVNSHYSVKVSRNHPAGCHASELRETGWICQIRFRLPLRRRAA